MHNVRISIPSFRSEDNPMEKGYTVFKIEVLMNGRQHTVEKRYSEFHNLHKILKKSIKLPEIPSKHVRNWVPKVLEQRRHGLELYLQTIIMENEVLPKIFLDFLNIRHFPSLPKTESCHLKWNLKSQGCIVWCSCQRYYRKEMGMQVEHVN
ncbi:sorting nexin-24-like isoform X2 [Oncorhynchus nerka]|uniref:sorting nexin-24-like isoform X2 n=1 Tax=Oncorhynchus nerka TaxID=8023 RepID=UPI0011310F4C|nr:sorting nexin-24-like isoform X2 [Oncorhynchus nerka]